MNQKNDPKNTENQEFSRKLGANRSEDAKKTRKKDANFSQSKDIHEDRSVRQRTTGHKK